MIIGTYRDVELSRQHPLSRTLGELTRERLFQRVLLRGLDQEDVGRFVELVSGVNPPSGMVEAVHRQTEGNPLFVTEVVRLLVQEGELTQDQAGKRDSWSVRIPEGVREVIGRRLDRLSERCNETLTIASVIGREFTLDQLSPLIEDMSGDRLLEVLEEALSARVIEELPRTVRRYQFTHALIQETLAGELSTIRKVRLHARIAEDLEELYGSDAEDHAAELAHHFAEAQAVLGVEKLVRYSLIAGERALAIYAYEEALKHCQRALAAKEGKPMDAETAALLFGLGRAQLATLPRHRLTEAELSLVAAFDYYAEAGDVSRAVAIAQYPLPPTPGLFRDTTQLIRRALELVPPDSRQALPLLSRYIRALSQSGDYAGAEQALQQQITIAQREGDSALEMQALASAAILGIFQFHYRESLEQVVRAIELATLNDEPRAESELRQGAVFASLGIGHLEEARAHATAMIGLAERLGDRNRWATSSFVNLLVSCFEGKWQAAREFGDRGLAAEPHDPRLLGFRAIVEYEVGDYGRGEAYLDQLLEVQGLATPGTSWEYIYPAWVLPLVARIKGVADRFDVAEEIGDTILTSETANADFLASARTGLALISVERGDTAAAAQHYEALKPHQGIMLRHIPATVDRLLGLLSQTMGNQDQAAQHFGDALAFCLQAGYRPELAWTCCDYADLLLERNAEGDRAKATSLLDESLAISSELGMRPLMERVLSRREILKA